MSESKDRGGAIGCGIIILIFAAVFGVPFLWNMYDNGVFDGKQPDPATAPIFGPSEAGRLVERLDTAARAQGICYGWVIDSGRSARIPVVTPSYGGTFSPQPTTAPSARPVPNPSAPPAPGTSQRSAVPAPPSAPNPNASPRSAARPRATAVPRPASPPPTVPPEVTRELSEPGVEFGSNLGVGVDPRQAPARCPQWAILTAQYSYSSIDKEWTSGSVSVQDNLGAGNDLRLSNLDRLGLTSADLVGDNATGRLADAIGAVPLLLAEEGRARPVAPAAGAVPAGDEISSSRGAGFYVFTTIAIVLIAGGAVWIAVAAVRSRKGSS
ncbi:hypothetical protein [Actinomadura hibisca]|uniref:hypothetical protein n=1 Tax=Actinomadura hibisca TaxID=68565 RepID=UPI00082BF70B|nr:hypothetical protein [Actinomadura hibisca]